jgi:hypothetical protein
MKRVWSLMIVGLMLWNGSVWAEKQPVYDDDGEVITEEEIKAKMGKGWRTGCGCAGGCLSAVSGLVVGTLLGVGRSLLSVRPRGGEILDWIRGGNFSGSRRHRLQLQGWKAL